MSGMNRDKATALLRSTGLSPTRNRMAVLACLDKNHEPMTAREMLESVSLNRPMNKVTLYRILDLLADKGVILRHMGADRSCHYCMGTHAGETAHCHFFCNSCGKMQCLPADFLPPTFSFLKASDADKSLPMRVDSVELRLDGICPSCLEKAL